MGQSAFWDYSSLVPMYGPNKWCPLFNYQVIIQHSGTRSLVGYAYTHSAGVYSKHRVIRIQWDLKNNADYAKIRITRRNSHWFWSI